MRGRTGGGPTALETVRPTSTAAPSVPGTTSLSNQGSVGVDYVMLRLENDVVTQVLAPANDYGDL